MIFIIFVLASLIAVYIYYVSYYLDKIESGEISGSGIKISQDLPSDQGAYYKEDTTGLPASLRKQLIESIDDPSFGPKDAKVIVVGFSDFECPFCKDVYPEVHKMIQHYKDTVHYIYRDFPVESLHENAFLAAQAAECADDQVSFWRMHDKLFDNQINLSYDSILDIAQSLSLSEYMFKKCLDDNKYLKEVEEDLKDGVMLGVEGTPTFFINGKMYEGLRTFEQFRTIIDRELAY